jgi:hypothetical protein
MQIRSFANGFELSDWTSELQIIPNTWGLVNSLGIFQDEGITTSTVVLESREGSLGLLQDTVRGARVQVNKDDLSKIRSFAVPYFTDDDYLTPLDLQGKRMYGTAAQPDNEAAAIARKLQRIRQNHAITQEFARCQAITAGTVYAPNGTVSTDFYTEFGVTRKVVGFDLNTATAEVIGKSEQVIAHIQDNVQNGSVVTDVMVLCSPEFFAALISHASVKEAYKYYTSNGNQEPLRQRLGTGLYRTFVHGGLSFIEYRGSYNGTKLIPANEAYAIPVGVMDMFKTFYSPANKFGFENTIGVPGYVFTYRDPKGEKIEIESEIAFMNLINRPQAVVRCTIAA